MITALANQIKSCDLKHAKFLLVDCAGATAVQASTTSIQYTRAAFYGYKAVSKTAAATANTAAVNIGYADPDAVVVTPAGSPVFVDVIAAGGYVLQGGEVPGAKYDLMDVYFLGGATDKVLIVYEQ